MSESQVERSFIPRFLGGLVLIAMLVGSCAAVPAVRDNDAEEIGIAPWELFVDDEFFPNPNEIGAVLRANQLPGDVVPADMDLDLIDEDGGRQAWFCELSYDLILRHSQRNRSLSVARSYFSPEYQEGVSLTFRIITDVSDDEFKQLFELLADHFYQFPKSECESIEMDLYGKRYPVKTRFFTESDPDRSADEFHFIQYSNTTKYVSTTSVLHASDKNSLFLVYVLIDVNHRESLPPEIEKIGGLARGLRELWERKVDQYRD